MAMPEGSDGEALLPDPGTTFEWPDLAAVYCHMPDRVFDRLGFYTDMERADDPATPELELPPGVVGRARWFGRGEHNEVRDVVAVLEDSAERIKFRDTEGIVWEIRWLTLELWEEYVRPDTGGPAFATMEAMRSFLLHPPAPL